MYGEPASPSPARILKRPRRRARSARSSTLLIAPWGPSKTPVLCRGRIKTPPISWPKIGSEVLLIAGQQVRGSSIDRRKKYRDIFVWKTYLPRQGEMHGLNKTDPPKQTGQPPALRGVSRFRRASWTA